MDETEPLLGHDNVINNEPHGIVRHGSKDFVVVDFDPNGDPDNPMEWPKAYRWGIVVLLAFMAFTVYVSSSP